MKKYERFAVHRPGALLRLRDCSLRQVPVGHVVAGVPQNVGLFDEHRRHVHPTLIGEHVAGDVDSTMGAQAIGPPVDEAVRVGIGTSRKKAEVIDPGLHDGVVGRFQAVLQRRHHVRREHDAVRIQCRQHLCHPRKQPDVGIKVDHGLGVVVLEQRLERIGLDGRVEFDDRVVGLHALDRWDREPIAGPDLGGKIHVREGSLWIGKNDHQDGVWMELFHRLHQRRRIGDVVG